MLLLGVAWLILNSSFATNTDLLFPPLKATVLGLVMEILVIVVTKISTIVVMTKITPAITATGTIIAGLVGVGVAVAVVVHVDSIDPEGESKNISSRLAVERIQAGPHSFCANDVAILNILDMSVTRDTTHFEMSWLNEVASKNIPLMSSTCDTFHSDMSWLKRVAW